MKGSHPAAIATWVGKAPGFWGQFGGTLLANLLVMGSICVALNLQRVRAVPVGYKDTLVAPAVAAVRNEAGEPDGYLVRRRKVASTPEARKQLTEMPGSQAALYYGNNHGGLWFDMQ
jgi:hypothetical protein